MTVDALFEENTLLEAKLFTDTMKVFSEQLAAIREREVDKVGRTRKVFSESLDLRLLGVINRAVEQQIRVDPPKDMTAIARLLQAAQQTYQVATERPKVQSSWRSSIEAKISKLEASTQLLQRARAHKLRSEQEETVALRRMGELGLVLSKRRDLDEAIHRLEEAACVYRKKLEVSDRRRAAREQNRSFELYRSSFYRELEAGEECRHSVPAQSIREFWGSMWEPRAEDTSFEKYLRAFHPGDEPQNIFPSFKEFQDIIGWLPNWKAPGPDGIFNFWIKKLTSLHQVLYDVVGTICADGSAQDSWFYKGTTYLIPKGEARCGADFRPITCMSNLYKLTTKCVARSMQQIVERRGLLSGNQMGCVRFVEAAKEQVLVDKLLAAAHGHSLSISWVDVKKAYDSIDHAYLLRCIENLCLPPWILDFLRTTISHWQVEIRCGSEILLEKYIRRGILQGDSLSPLLFVLCLDPLSRMLTADFPQLTIQTDAGAFCSNHLLFVDDLKLLATDDANATAMLDATDVFFKAVGLEMNRSKSATNVPECGERAKLLDGVEGYKYLGIVQDSCGRLTGETFARVRGELLRRVEKLCESKLSGRNLIQAINEYAISLINYYVGIIDLEPVAFIDLDQAVRQVLIKHHLHLQPASKDRLYLPRSELGRGLHSMEHRSECILAQLYLKMHMQRHSCTRRAAILKESLSAKSHFSLILSYLAEKYKLPETPTIAAIKEAQRANLYSEIKNRFIHQKLYRARENEMVSIEDSSVWLKKGSVKARDEAALFFLQDRNMFFGADAKCPHCGSAKKTVDHLATRCESMLGHDYTMRHNEVVRCIHLALCTKYNIKRTKRLRNHSVQETVSGPEATIVVDTRVKTDVKIQHNRPDIVVHDKKRKEVILVEIGITSQDQLQRVETEKQHKYDMLAKEMGMMYKCSTRIIPYVVTWEGIVTKCRRRHSEALGLSPRIEAYIQSVVLKKTLESISYEHRRSIYEREDDEDGTERALARLVRTNLTECGDAEQ